MNPYALFMLALAGGATAFALSRGRGLVHGMRLIKDGDKCVRIESVNREAQGDFASDWVEANVPDDVDGGHAEPLMIKMWGELYPECPWPPAVPDTFTLPNGETWPEAVATTQEIFEEFSQTTDLDFAPRAEGFGLDTGDT